MLTQPLQINMAHQFLLDYPNPCAGQPNDTLFPNPTNPNGFFVCYQELPIPMHCPESLVWNDSQKHCDYPILTNPCEDQPTGTLLPNPDNFHGFLICNHGMAIPMDCPDNLVWNDEMKYCDYYSNVPTTVAPPPTTTVLTTTEEIPEPEPVTTAIPEPITTNFVDPFVPTCDPPRKWPSHENLYFFDGSYWSSKSQKLNMNVYEAEYHCKSIDGIMAEPKNIDEKNFMNRIQEIEMNKENLDNSKSNFYVGIEGEGFSYVDYYYGLEYSLTPGTHNTPFNQPTWWMTNYPDNQSDEEAKNIMNSMNNDVINYLPSDVNDLDTFKNVNGFIHRANGVNCQYRCE